MDSTPVECGRSVATTTRWRSPITAATATAQAIPASFLGMRLHLACAPDGTPRGMALVSAPRPEREGPPELLPEALRGGETLVCGKAMPGLSSPKGSASWAPSSSDPSDWTSAAPSLTSHRFVSGSSRCFGPARTSSASSVMAHGRSRALRPGRIAGSSPSLPPSPSTTGSGVRPRPGRLRRLRARNQPSSGPWPWAVEPSSNDGPTARGLATERRLR